MPSHRRCAGFRQSLLISAAAGAFFLCGCTQRDQASPDTTALSAEVAQLKAQVAYLNDRQQIHDVYLHYSRGLDRNDVELMGTAFWPDVQINYGTQSISFDEFVVVHLAKHPREYEHYAHLLSNESVEINGDVAHVEIYVTRLSNSRTNKRSMIIAGRYIDRLDRRNGEWRIAMREFIPHYVTETDTAIGAYIKASDWSKSACGLGATDKRDPSYRRPLSARTDKSFGPACAE